MGKIIKNNEEYYIEFTARGLSYQKKAGLDWASAEKLLRETEDKIRKGELLTEFQDVKCQMFFDEFLKNIVTVHTKKTLTRFEDAIDHFNGFLSKYPEVTYLSQITPAIIEGYRANCIENSSKEGRIFNFHMLLLREVFDFARKQGYINDNPTLHIKGAEYQRGFTPRVMTEEQQLKLMSAQKDDINANCLKLLLLAAIRLKELMLLKKEDINFGENVIVVPSNDQRKVPIDPRAIELLEEIYSCGGFINYLKKYSGSKGLEQVSVELNAYLYKNFKGNLNFIVIRNTFVNNSIKRGVSFGKLYRFVGFNDIIRLYSFSHFLLANRIDRD